MEQLITRENVAEAVQAIQQKAPGFVPQVAIELGSGMGEMAAGIQDAVVIPYEDVPHMVPSTVQGHAGRFILGTLSGKRVICMQGRLHAYEGNSAQQIAFPVYVMRELGAPTLVVTNAAGGIEPSYQVGDVMLISDHINLQGMNPGVGVENGFGPRFYDMTHAYDPELRKLARDVAQRQGLGVHEGVYIGLLGPSFETPAEIRAFGIWGAQAVGMSTVQEVIAANQLGVRVLGVSLISNPAAGVCDEPLSIDDVIKAANVAAGNIWHLIEGVVAEL
ncbi:MAG: purine-nucleoside phosphorylase [Coriobacteriia bacterium]|nr:purine-nucleoside phosphorylase [Coriobacteriia bacterium]